MKRTAIDNGNYLFLIGAMICLITGLCFFSHCDAGACICLAGILLFFKAACMTIKHRRKIKDSPPLQTMTEQ